MKAAIQKWRDDRFGMFIHWGLYSIPGGVWKGQVAGGGEWNAGNYAEHLQLRLKMPNAEYAELASQFNPIQFDADAWVLLAKQAGMRHVVFTAKHQDGFAMYHSHVSNFNVVDATPFGRDPLKELADACRRHGLGIGIYYSHARDHHHPLANWNEYGNTWDFPKRTKEDFIRYLDDKAKPQIEELLTGYGELTCMWFDVPYNIPVDQSRKIVDLVRHHQPACLVNSRVGGDVWDYRSLGDNEISDVPLDEPWETCITMNDSWGFNQLDANWTSAEQIASHFKDITQKGGCLLLNVGPTGEGAIPEPSISILQQLHEFIAKQEKGNHEM